MLARSQHNNVANAVTLLLGGPLWGRRYLFLTGYRQELRLVMTEGFMATWVQESANIVAKYGAMEHHLGIPSSCQSSKDLKK